MICGPKPTPTALRRLQGNPGKRGYNHAEPQPPEGVPDCPSHLNAAAHDEWDRLVHVLHDMGVVTAVDRAALAAYCQCYGRWVEAEQKLQTTPMLLKTATGYVQQSPLLSIANKQLELMGRYMTELGLTPAARSRVAACAQVHTEPVRTIELVVGYRRQEGLAYEKPMNSDGPAVLGGPAAHLEGQILLDGDH